MDENELKKILQDMDVPAVDENARKIALNMAVSAFEEEQLKKSSKKFQGVSFWSRLMGMSNSKTRKNDMEAKSKKRLVYGGMATAAVAVLVFMVPFGGHKYSVQPGAYLNGNHFSNISVKGPATTIAEKIASVFHDEENTERAHVENRVVFKPSNEGEAVGSSADMAVASADSNYIDAIEEINERNVENAVRQDASSLPVPIEPPVGVVSLNEKQASQQVSKRREGLRQELNLSENIAWVDPPAGMTISNGNEGAIKENFQDEDPLTLWKRLQEERLERELNKVEDFKIAPFVSAAAAPVSTFSVDVDTAAYSFVRRQINNGVLPRQSAVRVEEMINYFDYDYALPESKAEPFKPTVTLLDSPWAEGRKLMHVGIKGYDLDRDVQPKSNLVFLLDVSGSMSQVDKLPLLKNSFKLLLETLKPDDTVSIVTYAGHTGVALEPTKVSDKSKILNVLQNLHAGGATAGAAGIELAYQQAEQSFDKNAVNRVILATDGDFNVGIRDHKELQSFIERKREGGVFLSVLGFGQGNYNDQMMQTLAQNGNGVAAYIDSLSEARKVLVEEATSALFPIAKDVKIQVEFNPAAVAEYRLIGYETRALAREDFNNDKVDAGDIGAGHAVTAIYEIVPVGSAAVSVDPLRYGDDAAKAGPVAPTQTFDGEYGFLKIRYKLPNENTSKLITTPITSALEGSAGRDQNFASAVAGFGQLLQGAQYMQDFSYDDVIALAQANRGDDEFGYRAEFINLVRLAKSSGAIQRQ